MSCVKVLIWLDLDKEMLDIFQIVSFLKSLMSQNLAISK